MNQISNPFTKMLVSFDPDRFFGRHSIIEPILQGTSSREPRSFAIYGARTIGKTSLLKFLCEPNGALAKHKSALLEYGPGLGGELEFIYFDCYYVDGDTLLSALYKRFLRSDRFRQLGDRFPSKEIEESSTKLEVKKALLNLLRVLQNEDIRLAACLDHFDKAFQSMTYEDDVFLRNLTGYQSFVVATEKSLTELRRDFRRTSPLLNILIPRNIKLLTEAEARGLIKVPTIDTKVSFAPVEVDFILETAGRHPHLLTIVCEFFCGLCIQHLEVRELLPRDKKVQQQVKLQMMALPAVNELFLLFWNQLDEYERQVLSKISMDKTIDPETELSALNTLRERALIYENLQEGKYHVFSELFRDFALHQRFRRRGGIEAILDSLGHLDRELLEYLLARPNQLCSFEELLREVWGAPTTSKRALEAAIHRLRQRLQDTEGTDWEYIQNIRGKGYLYVPRSR